jgi:Reverse transcriptase (RNA-dependent DNA polymerase)
VRKKWRDAILKELLKMKQSKVWRIIKRRDMNPGRECVKCKWVFNIKHDGTFRARSVACGYSQVLGVDFQESYSRAINDTVFHILIVCQILWGLIAVLLDVEVAFLNGDLDEVIYMECPKGLVGQEDEVVLLNKSMYGLLQAARQFFLKFCKTMKKVGFRQSQSEPCLFYKKMNDHMILMAIHVDDFYGIG